MSNWLKAFLVWGITAIICMLLHYRAGNYLEKGIEIGKEMAYGEMESNVHDLWEKDILRRKDESS